MSVKSQKSWRDVNAIYQIYPRSFQDSNGDGVGDLRGATSRLDYLSSQLDSLGVDAIWFSPFFPSPMADFGYDVSDYCDIDPLFGTLDDFRELLAQAHARDIKVMIDFVPNHTSHEHTWFKISRSSRDNDKRNYYVWRDPTPDGSPPNNWLSIFGGSAWQWDETTGQYYLHTFLKEQPDLNWDNPAVRQEMQQVLHFWFGLGVDGIRADAVRWIAKDPELRDDPPNPKFTAEPPRDPYWGLLHRYSRFGDKLFTYLREMTDVVQQYPERIMIFEDYPDEIYSTREQYLGFYGINPRVSMPFNFEGMGLPFTAEAYRNFVTEFQGMLNPAEHVPVYCFGNHDQPRLATRSGVSQARVIALMQLCLPGIPVIYYGDELGMVNGEILPEQERDPLNQIQPGVGAGRDPERTPMQWDTSVHAGFSAAEPWLPLAGGIKRTNVATQLQQNASFLALYRQLLRLRRQHAVLRRGDYETFGEPHEQVFVFSRRLGEEHVFVVLNFGRHDVSYQLPHGGRVLCGTNPADLPALDGDGLLHLRRHEAALVECAKHPLKDD